MTATFAIVPGRFHAFSRTGGGRRSRNFGAPYQAAISRGWKISVAALPTFDFNHASANAPGPYYRPAFTDPLFDA